MISQDDRFGGRGYDPARMDAGLRPRRPTEEDAVQRVVASVRPTRPRVYQRVHRWTLSLALACVLTLVGGYGRAAGAAPEPAAFTAGSTGLGDPYFPLDGNGGYDVRHYGLDIRYDPATKGLVGIATITAMATQDLSRFNLDLVGLSVRSIDVVGVPATWTRTKGELAVTPAAGLPAGEEFSTVVRYDGVPTPIHEPTRIDAASGFLPSADGALFAGEPHVASRWFPVNDSLLDKAAYTFAVTVPAGRTALANGVLTGHDTVAGRTTWTWEAVEPMAPYLAGVTIGTFDLRAYAKDGLPFWDAVETSLVRRVRPHTGSRYALSGATATAYSRLSRSIRVPAKGSNLSFWVDRPKNAGAGAFFVEAHTPGRGDWTTLRDRNGHTTRTADPACAYLVDRHPFLAHYLHPKDDGTCAPQGSTGRWWGGAAGRGYQHWSVDLGRFAGRTIEVAITYATASDQPGPGAFVDDVVVSTGAGTTSFEKDANTRDGWRSGRPPTGSPRKGGWIVGRTSDGPATVGERAQAVLATGPAVLDFLAARFGAYPFSSSGGIVHAFPFAGALENQTRPTYASGFFRNTTDGTSVLVHELAHQWFGASVTPAAWRDIWLNEGFATYAEWLWSEAHGGPTTRRLFNEAYRGPNNPFWTVPIADPGRGRLFDFSIYDRGAMTLHQLRRTIGDEDFFKILRQWADEHAGENVTTRQFITLAEHVSGRDLKAFFQAWLFTGTRPKA
jgi:hypothetical protein